MSYSHNPVLLQQAIDSLNIKEGSVCIDGTLGGGGHTKVIAQLVGDKGRVLAIDYDIRAISVAQKNLGKLKSRVVFAQGNFKDMDEFASSHGIKKADAILLDLGISSGQLDDTTRGFSFSGPGELDMRFSPETQNLTAREIINTWPQKELLEIFKSYGEENLAGLIAKRIIETREIQPIETTTQLADLVERIYRKKYRGRSKTHPATKVFQALRIAVNKELDSLAEVLPKTLELLPPQGRLAVISFHSLEDRIVKHFFKDAAKGCVCPIDFPKCICNNKPLIKIITKKAVCPTEQEVKLNPRSRSAKLRVAQKL